MGSNWRLTYYHLKKSGSFIAISNSVKTPWFKKCKACPLYGERILLNRLAETSLHCWWVDRQKEIKSLKRCFHKKIVGDADRDLMLLYAEVAFRLIEIPKHDYTYDCAYRNANKTD